MRYCPSCRTIEEEDLERCPTCHKQLNSKVAYNDPVVLLVSTNQEADRLQAALEDEKIPSERRPVKKAVSLPLAVSANPNGSVQTLVPFGALDRARDIAIGIGALQPEGQEPVVPGELADQEKRDEEEAPTISPVKRFLVRAISVILFILLVWLVVSGTDWVMGLITGR